MGSTPKCTPDDARRTVSDASSSEQNPQLQQGKGRLKGAGRREARKHQQRQHQAPAFEVVADLMRPDYGVACEAFMCLACCGSVMGRIMHLISTALEAADTTTAHAVDVGRVLAAARKLAGVHVGACPAGQRKPLALHLAATMHG